MCVTGVMTCLFEGLNHTVLLLFPSFVFFRLSWFRWCNFVCGRVCACVCIRALHVLISLLFTSLHTRWGHWRTSILSLSGDLWKRDLIGWKTSGDTATGRDVEMHKAAVTGRNLQHFCFKFKTWIIYLFSDKLDVQFSLLQLLCV